MVNSSNRNGIQLMNKSLALFMNTFILFVLFYSKHDIVKMTNYMFKVIDLLRMKEITYKI